MGLSRREAIRIIVMTRLGPEEAKVSKVGVTGRHDEVELGRRLGEPVAGGPARVPRQQLVAGQLGV